MADKNFQLLQCLPQCVPAYVKNLGGHDTQGLLNVLNGLTVVQTTHTAGLLGRGPTTHKLYLARPATFDGNDLRTELSAQDADKLVRAWQAQARSLALA